MTQLSVKVECPVYDSFRVQQVAGMFDIPLSEHSTEQFDVELPDANEDWQIGLIVGPSGSGKSTIAREAFGDKLYQGHAWPQDKAVIDCFGDLPVRRVVELFTAVGFGSPPSWVKPYSVLSNGERFRCDLARSLAVGFDQQGEAEPIPPTVAFDEFTSVVDRNVARVASAAISKGVRKGNLPCRFIGVTCHYDIAEWLEPDWILDMATCRLERRRLRRPRIELEVHRCRVDAWRLFARHHYLSGTIAPQARCYLATWNGEPVSFAATLPVIAKKNHRRFSRIVTLPDFQGIGVGMRFVGAVAQLHRDEGWRINVTSSHPALINHCRNSDSWRAVNVKKTGQGGRRHRPAFRSYRSSAGRAVVSFEYFGKSIYTKPTRKE